MPKNRPSVAIISVNFNQTELTLEMLQSLQKASLHQWAEVWVVDNASNIDGSQQLKNQYPWVNTLRSEENLGFAGGNNLAVRKTNADYVFLLNNDALIEKDVLESMIAKMEADPKIGALSPVVLDYPVRNDKPTIQYAGFTKVNPFTGRNSISFKGQGREVLDKGLKNTAYAHGAAMLVPRRVIEEVGLMEESYFLYYEEFDWCCRIVQKGYKIVVDYDNSIWHRESVSTGVDSPFKIYWINKSRILFMRKNHSFLNSLIFKAYYLLFVIPRHAFTSLLAGRKQHAKSYVKAYIDQPSLTKMTTKT